ncbi:hypothetical protein SELR_pSRC102010 (plasmid) [Selenomonas ruminantium subsp. lactilytica TAM6421]|uniref:Uncharacterized protein n=1 Tax=Selenomonas ruminantium subsp. lactilytica (strain NBRC 103574 / TAM6421) TaxID=927704 RepID=I0GW71_SELRL|nr:hypothetical protein [Selenomonas ruminantium]BAL85008.1 hypothetical protein SELR_pSRC102010 [Selenomonas ruminantium subsp. lactilytica TAM6421]
MFNGKVITKVNTNNIVDNDIFDNNIFTNDEKITLDINIEQLISEYNDNRKEINRLVFECVTEMTEGDKAELNLSKRNFFHRIIGEITGSNQNLQNKINSNHTAAQYAALEILQKLERKNLINFTLITAVNNKLNASIISKNKESKRIYSFLKDFIKKNRNRFYHYETRLDIAEQKINLLEWCNSIKYQEFNGEEYINMDNTKKIVCLVRDFYELTNGNWSFPDLLLLKTAMSDIKISPNSYVNYYTVLKEIHDKPLLKKNYSRMQLSIQQMNSHILSHWEFLIN